MLLDSTVIVQTKGAFLMNQNEKTDRRQLWISRMCDLEDSGMTQEEWCRSHNIAYSTFRYWISKLKKESESSKTNWLKVDMTAGKEVASLRIPDIEKINTSCITIRIGDFTVELPSDADPQRAFEVLCMLKSV